MGSSILLLVVILVFMALSAFFSASETAFFSMDEIKIRSFPHHQAKAIRKLLKKAADILVALLTANTVTNIILTTLISAYMAVIGVNLPFIVASIVVSTIIIVMGEILPKTFATLMPLKVIPFALKPVQYLTGMMGFLIRPINALSEACTRYFQHHLPDPDNKDDRRAALYNIVSRGKFLNNQEKQLIGRVLSLAERHVTEIMTPRPRVFSTENTQSLAALKEELIQEKHTRIPVYKDQDSQVIGVIHIEDIIIALQNPENSSQIVETYLRPLYYVPESKSLAGLLEDFRFKHIEIAAVVDEYGDFLGIITLSDILAELVGEVVDEDIESDIKQLLPNRYLVKGEVSLTDFNQTFGTGLESEDYETLAGFLIEQAGGLPPLFYSFQAEGVVITVRERTATRIESLSVRVKK